MSPKEIETQLVELLEDEQKREEAIRKCASFVLNNRGSWEEAKEVFSQAVFSVLYKAKKEEILIKGGNLAAYLHGACRNLWRTKLRNRKNKQHMAEPEENQLKKIAQEDHSSETIELEARYLAMEKCLHQLDQRCKKILNGFYWEKKSYREIASIHDITEDNARKIAGRCREKLKICIKKREESYG